MSPFWPHRRTSASEVRSFEIGQALGQVGHVETVVLQSEDDREDAADDHVSCRLPVKVQPRHTLVQKLNWALNPRSPWPHGVGADQTSLEHLRQMSRQFDLTWFFKLRSANAFPSWAWESSVVDIDDVPSTFEDSTLRTAQSVPDRVSTSVRVWAWRRREKLLGERFTVLTVCSNADQQYLRNLGVRGPIHVVANGFDAPPGVPSRHISDPPRIGFIGIFDHGPNVEGIRWFVRYCWPRIKRTVPEARLRIVGRFSDGRLRPEGADLDALGWVENPDEEIATWSAMVVPVRTGAGTRGKIAHAFSRKCPVVSTTLGAYGYDPQDGRTMLVADSPESFAAACVRAIREPAYASAIADRAWSEFLEKWTWDAIRPHIWAAAEDCLRAPALLTTK